MMKIKKVRCKMGDCEVELEGECESNDVLKFNNLSFECFSLIMRLSEERQKENEDEDDDQCEHKTEKKEETLTEAFKNNVVTTENTMFR